MYTEHYGLQKLPFGITPDTQFFFAHSSYQEALNTLLIAARSGEGFLKVVGEVGTGKTLLCRKFLNQLETESFVTAFIPNPYLEPMTLLLAVAALASTGMSRLPLPRIAIGALLLAAVPMLQWIGGQVPYLGDAALSAM